MDLERTAYHKAGHAIIGTLRGFILEEVTVEPDKEEDRLGLACSKGWYDTIPEGDEAAARCLRAAGGPAAETVRYGEFCDEAAGAFHGEGGAYSSEKAAITPRTSNGLPTTSRTSSLTRPYGCCKSTATRWTRWRRTSWRRRR